MKRNLRGVRLGTKIALFTFVFGAVVGIALTLVFSQYTQNSVLTQARIALMEQAHQAAHFVDALLDSRVEVSNSIAAAQTIEIATNLSNAEFGSLSEETRLATIQDLDARWQNTESIQDPFIAQYLENNAARALGRQMTVHPGKFGEIFLTNRFGALIATTGKLTTLAHGHKYWWLAAFNDGQGAFFLDDRGYDISVGDYVLGVVVPVMSNGEVIGILKCNFSILPAIEDAMVTSDHVSGTEILLARSNGLVIYDEEQAPLQTPVSGELRSLISDRTSGWTTVQDGERTCLAAFWEVPWTSEATLDIFGATPESIDHSFGNS
ncbi:cache domain-containing protein, partial [Candidatus Bipolaricaulota bacterium]|nr:cache domain-containing protein [Candidatus Bipolaricaulota bacterium]